MKVDPEFDYAEAHDPDTWRIMGVRLLAFRTGHKLILQRVKSPLLFEWAGEAKPSDLIYALWVCSRSYKAARRGKLSLLWKRKAAGIARDLEKNPDVFKNRLELFRGYMDEGEATPARMRPVPLQPGEARREETIAPSLMVLKRELLGRIVFSEAEFFELPMRRAWFERLGQLEKESAVTWPETWEGR